MTTVEQGKSNENDFEEENCDQFDSNIASGRETRPLPLDTNKATIVAVTYASINADTMRLPENVTRDDRKSDIRFS